MNNTLKPLGAEEEAIEKRLSEALRKSDDRATLLSLLRLCSVIAIVLILFFSFFGFTTVRDRDMYPALFPGDLALTYRYPSFRKGEIVVYETGDGKQIGRIAAKAGDVIDFSADGKFYVNGTAQTTEIFFPTYPPEGWQGSTVVPEGKVFILGDYRTQSADSRRFGFIDKSSVKSRIIALLRHNQL